MIERLLKENSALKNKVALPTIVEQAKEQVSVPLVADSQKKRSISSKLFEDDGK